MEPLKPIGPFIRQWDGDDRAHFYSWAHKTYAREKNDGRWRHRKNRTDRYHQWHLAYRLFRVGKRNYVLDKSLAEFWEWIEPPPHVPYDYGRYERRIKTEYEDFYPRKGAHFRQKIPTGYGKSKNHWDDPVWVQKQEWRHRRRGRCEYHRSSSRRGWAKKYCNAAYRRYEKQTISHEKWEDLHTKLPKDWFDPWMWD
jgi:hypothetical protein